MIVTMVRLQLVCLGPLEFDSDLLKKRSQFVNLVAIFGHDQLPFIMYSVFCISVKNEISSGKSEIVGYHLQTCQVL